MHDQDYMPPKMMLWLMSRFSIHYHKQSALGDLEEIYRDICEESGVKTAKSWYRKQVLGSIPSLINSMIYRNSMIFRNNMKTGFRNIRKNRGYSFTNIVGLAIGLSCCILTAMWVQYEYSYDKFHKKIDNIYRLAFDAEAFSFRGEYVVGAAPDYLKENYPEVADATIFGSKNVKLVYEDKSFFSSGYFVHPSFLEIFTFPVLDGDIETAFSNPLSIIITEELATRFFGTPEAVGKIFRVDDAIDFPVAAVLKDIPSNSSLQFEFLLSNLIAPAGMRGWQNKAAQAFVLLNEGVSHTEFSEKIKDIYNDRNIQDTANDYFLQPFSEIHLFNLNGGGLITYIYIFSVMAAIILIIACFNFMNLSTACSEKRHREIGIKKVVGSTRKQLMFQFFSESLLLVFVSFVLALLLSRLLLFAIGDIIGRDLEPVYSFDFVLIMSGILVLTGLISGLYPAVFLSSFKPVVVLKGGRFSGMKRWSVILRRLLVVSQFTFSILFIVCALVIFKQLNFIKNKDLGFEKNNIVMVPVHSLLMQMNQEVKNELLKRPEIISISLTSNNLTGWNSSVGVDWDRNIEKKAFDVGLNWVDYDYKETLGLEITKGRFFSAEYGTDLSETCVINEALERELGMEDPIGKRITRSVNSPSEETREIIGVVRDYHTESLHGVIRPFMLIPATRMNSGFFCIRTDPDNIGNTIEYIRSTTTNFVPDYPFQYSFLDNSLDRIYRTEKLTGTLILYLTYIAIFISCLGLFGLAAYSVERKIKEIGIRKAFGASVRDVMKLLTKEYFWLILASNAIAIPFSYFIMSDWLREFHYRTSFGTGIFITAAVLSLFISFLTIYRHAFKAARSNPVDTLRYE
ncbi:ABC transporter permease [candidate division KSB1 bacterium]